MTLTLCDGSKFELPMFDPVVATHVNASHSLVQTLIDQIEKEKLYARFFEGKKGLTFLDIGANIGLVSIYASPACDRIVAVEPAPETFKVLKAMTHSFEQITLVEAALSPASGNVEFFVNNINSTASSTVNTYGQKISVQGLTSSDLLRIYQLESVDIVKCDSEGAEGDALTYDELRTAAPIVKSYFIETHNCPKTTWNDKMGKLIANLTHLGYTTIGIHGMALVAERP